MLIFDVNDMMKTKVSDGTCREVYGSSFLNRLYRQYLSYTLETLREGVSNKEYTRMSDVGLGCSQNTDKVSTRCWQSVAAYVHETSHYLCPYRSSLFCS